MIGKVPMFVKWAGGKKQLLGQLDPIIPGRVERYFEPFVGGGAVAFSILKSKKPKEVFISDINEELINAYEVMKNNVDGLIRLLKEHKKKHCEEFYYKMRSEDPTKMSPVERAARFVYLNRTCFNGLYRVNSKGQFNVPMGRYKDPTICPEKDLREISQLLKNVEIRAMPFREITKYVKMGDFVYFDPPYYPINGNSFTSYAKDDFAEKDQVELAAVFKQLDKLGCKVMLSNSDTPFIKNLYANYNIHTVMAARMINCDGAGRGKVKELVITNYNSQQKTLKS